MIIISIAVTNSPKTVDNMNVLDLVATLTIGLTKTGKKIKS